MQFSTAIILEFEVTYLFRVVLEAFLFVSSFVNAVLRKDLFHRWENLIIEHQAFENYQNLMYMLNADNLGNLNFDY